MIMKLWALCLCLFIWPAFSEEEDDCFKLCSSGVCCAGSMGRTLCCPTINGICCENGKFCCPEGSTCNLDGTCTLSGSESHELRPILRNVESLLNVSGASLNWDPFTQCSPESTECSLKNGQFSCCPHKDAVCCGDSEHCCPNGYTCDASTGSCHPVSASRMGALPTTEPPKTLQQHNCNLDDSSTCDRTINTCCIMDDGAHGCCPYAEADCCSDGRHCCPRGMRCTPTSDSCEPAGGPWVNPFRVPGNYREPAKSTPSVAASDVSNEVCPDGESVCPGKSTCCLMASAEYGCCPFEQATCCSDGEHCCPKDYNCNPVDQSCTPAASAKAAAAAPVAPAAAAASVGGVKCSDGHTTCPDDNTCCLLKDGTFGCCPLPQAVCCPDHIHCCPSGTVCDMAHSSCISRGQGEVTVATPWFTKTRPKVANTVCPGGESACPGDSTCCLMTASSKDYGCCPFENGVCCPGDAGGHCCPSGYSCGATGQCDPDTLEASPRTSKARFLAWYRPSIPWERRDKK